MHHSILPHLMGGCVKFRVKRSALFDASASSYGAFTPAAATNRRTTTLSFFVKLGKASLDTSATYEVISADTAVTTRINFANGFSKLNVLLSSANTQTLGVFRDPTAWYHILIVIDTTQATASERVKIYVNGVNVTDVGGSTYPAQNFDTGFNNNAPVNVGRRTSGSNYFDGLLAQMILLDGLRVDDPFSFIQTDVRSGSVAARLYAGGWGGNNSFYLPFLGDAGDAPATAAEGWKDRSGKGNNFTPGGFASSDFIKDTPTNYRAGSDYRGNFCTLNPISPHGSGMTLSRGNLRFAAGSTATNYSLPGTVPMKSGKWYWEVDVITVGQAIIGLAKADSSFVGNSLAGTAPVYAYQNNGQVYAGGAAAAYGAALANADRVGVLYDASAGKLYIAKNNAWQGGADPVAGTGGITVPANAAGYYPYVESGSAGSPSTLQVNFGQRDFAYPAPSGCSPLCAAAAPPPTKVKRATAVAQAYDTAANIAAAIAAKRATWGAAYIDVYKRTDGVEGYRWRFGDDPAFYLDTTDVAAAKQAFPAFAGTQYVAASLRTGAEYGITTGTVAHVNGGATVVADGLSTTRKFIFLRRTDAGGNWPASHPDCTAGKLLYLNSTAGEATAGDITSITSGGFSIGAAMPSGNYRWVAIAEASGAVSLKKFDGNNSAAGPVVEAGGTPGLHMLKLLSGGVGAGSWHTRFGIRNSSNPARNVVMMENTVQERTSDGSGNFEVDILANGIKLINARSDNNGTAAYVTVSILDSIFAPGACPAQGTAR